MYFEIMAIQINIRKLIKYLGGTSAFCEAHREVAQKYGFRRLPESTVNGWINRNILKYQRLSEVYMVAISMNLPLDLRDFVEFEYDGKYISLTRLGLAHAPIPNVLLKGEENDIKTTRNLSGII